MSNNKKKHHEDLTKITNHKLRKSFNGSGIVFKDHQNPKKYSEIFHEYMGPEINELIDDEVFLKEVLNFGQLIWNKAVAEDFPDHSKSKDIETIFPLYKATFPDKPLISEFLNRKKKLFGDDNFFIVKQTSLISPDGRLAISVAVEQLEG